MLFKFQFHLSFVLISFNKCSSLYYNYLLDKNFNFVSNTFEAKKRGRTANSSHAIGRFAGVSSKTTGAILAGNDPVNVSWLQFDAIFVPFENRLRNTDHFALQVYGTLVRQYGAQTLKKFRFLVMFGND